MANTPIIRKGHCINVGVDGCPLAKEHKIIEVGIGEEFVCPECGGTLIEEQASKGIPAWVWAVVAAVVVAGGAAGGYFALRDTNVYVSDILLDKTACTVVAGESATISATVEPEDATDNTLVWSSSDNEVLTVSGGTITALKAGKAVVSVKSNDGKAAAEVEVTVEEVDTTVCVSKITTDKESCTLTEGKEETITATVEPEDATDKTVVWSSSDETVATVAEGVVKGLKAGKATVTAASADGKVSASVEITVGKAPEASRPQPAGPTCGTFSGTLKNGYPHGTGTLTFSVSRRIDSHDQQNRMAQPGDYLIGEWDNGHLIQARWYDASNNLKETIVLGKAMNPEQDHSLGKFRK